MLQGQCGWQSLPAPRCLPAEPPGWSPASNASGRDLLRSSSELLAPGMAVRQHQAGSASQTEARLPGSYPGSCSSQLFDSGQVTQPLPASSSLTSKVEVVIAPTIQAQRESKECTVTGTVPGLGKGYGSAPEVNRLPQHCLIPKAWAPAMSTQKALGGGPADAEEPAL